MGWGHPDLRVCASDLFLTRRAAVAYARSGGRPARELSCIVIPMPHDSQSDAILPTRTERMRPIVEQRRGDIEVGRMSVDERARRSWA
jgi:hypothetical protein